MDQNEIRLYSLEYQGYVNIAQYQYEAMIEKDMEELGLSTDEEYEYYLKMRGL